MIQEDRYNNITRERYQDLEIARSYHSQQMGGFTLKNAPAMIIARREVRLVARALAGLSPAANNALDVPCGTGKLTGLFEELGINSISMDISWEMLSVLQSSIEGEFRFRKLLRADAAVLPFPDTTFDCVVCLRLLHRVPHAIRLAMLKEFARVTRHHVIVSVGINDGIQRFRLLLRNNLSRLGTVPFPVASKDFRRELLAAGLTPIRTLKVLPLLSSEMLLVANKSE